MSDISDVLTVLSKLAAAAVYPDGTNSPSVTGSDIIVYPGWPASAGLTEDLMNDKVHVSVFPKAEERNTTRYAERYQVIKAPAPTLTLTIANGSGGALLLEGGGELLLEDGGALLLEGNDLTVTVGGEVGVPQNVALRINGKHYVYGVKATDTMATIAAALAALVGADIAGTAVNGPTITIGPTGRVQSARVGGFGTVARELRRQERGVMITIWAGSPELRDKVAAVIDVELACQRFITMPDGFAARLIYKSSLVVDALQKATLYRRDLNYTVEFATTKAEQAAAVIAPQIALGGGPLLLESGGALLLEDGSNLLLESQTTITA